MSTDVERIRQGMLMMHEFWANTIEVAISSFLLYRSLGVAFVAPIIVVVVCIFLAAGLASFTSGRQKDWMDKIQARVGMVRDSHSSYQTRFLSRQFAHLYLTTSWCLTEFVLDHLSGVEKYWVGRVPPSPAQRLYCTKAHGSR